MAQEPTSTPAPLAEIEHGPSQFEQFLENNLKKLLFVLVAIVVAVAAYIVITGLKDSEDHSAGEALLSASDIAGLRDVMDTFPNTPAAGSAAIFLAAEQWKDGRQEDSNTTLNTFLNNNPDHPARGTANLALAFHYLEQGQKDEAKTKLQTVADDLNAKHLAPLALLTLGDLEKAAGNEEEARSHYERALNDFPSNNPSTRTLATERLSLLGVAPPTKVAPEKPAETPTPADAPPVNNIPGIPSLSPSNPLLFPPLETETPGPPVEAPQTPAAPDAPAAE